MNRSVTVIKIGGNDLSTPDFVPTLAETIASMQASSSCVLVHGGGRTIDDLMNRLAIEPNYINGQRVTDEATLEIAEMVLSGLVNKTLVLALQEAGLDALGLSGIDRGLIKVEPWSPEMSRVGRIQSVRRDVLEALCADHIVPVISPISSGPGGKYNVNADHAAGAIAGTLKAEKLFFISNVPGVQLENGIAPALTSLDVRSLINTGTIHGGMVPKVTAALDALALGAQSTVITNLAGLKTGTGTTIIRSEGALA